jgi:hypothetical protein
VTALADNLHGSALTIDEHVREIGRTREIASRRTPHRRDESAYPAGAVEQGRASFCIEAEAIVGAIAATCGSIDGRADVRRAPGDAVDASMEAVTGGLYGLVALAMLAALTWPGDAIGWYRGRSIPSRRLLHETEPARSALAQLLEMRRPTDGFEEGWRLEAKVMRGAFQELTEAAARPGTNQWQTSRAFGRGLEQAKLLLEKTRLGEDRDALEFSAWRRVTVVLEAAAARPDRDELDARIAAAAAVLGVRPTLLTQERIVERALLRRARLSAEELAAGLQQRSGPQSELFLSRPLREYATADTPGE